jgi:hypothetical protein
MCDYSLQAIASRPAKVGDKLTVTNFAGTISRGFGEANSPVCDLAVCVLPGTELAFDAPPEYIAGYDSVNCNYEYKIASSCVGRFRQTDEHLNYTHHDAIEFVGGEIVKLHNLKSDQVATVLQLPAQPGLIKRVLAKAGLIAAEPKRLDVLA